MNELPVTFSALGDPTRFAIVDRLLTRGELAAGELLDIGDLSAPAISRHLKVLRDAGVVRHRVDKQRRIYSVCPVAVQRISAWTMTYREFWQGSLARLDDVLRSEADNHE